MKTSVAPFFNRTCVPPSFLKNIPRAGEEYMVVYGKANQSTGEAWLVATGLAYVLTYVSFQPSVPSSSLTPPPPPRFFPVYISQTSVSILFVLISQSSLSIFICINFKVFSAYFICIIRSLLWAFICVIFTVFCEFFICINFTVFSESSLFVLISVWVFYFTFFRLQDTDIALCPCIWLDSSSPQ